MNFALWSSLLFSVCHAATQVAVLEFGPSGSIHASKSSSSRTTVEGVASLWNVHRSRGLQHAGMPVVPDLFKKPDESVVIALSNVDLEAMKKVAGIIDSSIATMEVSGNRMDALLSHTDATKKVDPASFWDTLNSQVRAKGITGVSMNVEETQARNIDSKVLTALDDIKLHAEKSSTTIVVYLVVEEDSSSSQRRVLSRRLDEQQGGQDVNEQQNEGNNDENNMYNGFYYYDDNGKLVTNAKTSFEIQYFQVVLWTSLGLCATLFFVIYLMVNMPLEPDTLLFGEAVKLPGET